MFDRVKIGLGDYAAGRAIFIQALAPLGITAIREWPPDGVELSEPAGSVSLCL